MPRLFISQRPQPALPATPFMAQLQPRQNGRPTEGCMAHAPEMPSPSPPPVVMTASRPQMPVPETPLVLVPPVPKGLAALMDSHDLDNPYLLAAFNVLIDNNNNPMRVPDILQAVQKRGWTQVLHKHKDRPEQLFGNALRSHQRRRENLNVPSLVFMIDAGACWKHHEIDLSAASGRKKGKIWCFSQDAGFPCPYQRLGMDLNVIRRAQHPTGEEKPPAKKESRQRDEEDDGDDEGLPSAQGTTRKKRKLIPSLPGAVDANSRERFEPPAVRGSVIPVHPVASSLEPPPYIPAAPIITPHTTKPRIAHPGTRSTRSSMLSRAQQADAPVSRKSSRRKMDIDIDGLEGLEAMSDDEQEEPESTATEDRDVDEDQLLLEGMPAEPFMSVEPMMGPPNVPFETTYLSESDDDEDDFHVTMQEFSDDEDMSPAIKREDSTPAFGFGAASPMEDFDSSDGGASVVRTPTPGLLVPGQDLVSYALVNRAWEAFGDGPFHYGGIEGPVDWESERLAAKNEKTSQGWSRAASPDFNEHASRLMRPSPLHLAIDTSAFPSPTLGPEVNPRGTCSSRSSLSSASSSASLQLPATPLSELLDPFSSRQSSVISLPAATYQSHHPLILYSPCLSPMLDEERPLKCGLAHRYIYPSEEEQDKPLAESEVQELEELLDFGQDGETSVLGEHMSRDESPPSQPQPAMTTKDVPPTPLRHMPNLSASFDFQWIRSPSPILL